MHSLSWLLRVPQSPASTCVETGSLTEIAEPA